jgi:hypothetical protein
MAEKIISLSGMRRMFCIAVFPWCVASGLPSKSGAAELRDLGCESRHTATDI